LTVSKVNTIIIKALTAVLFIASCDKETNNPPDAGFSFFPAVVDTSTIVRFDASASADLESSLWYLQFRWDFEGDGVFETQFRKNHIGLWQYSSEGVYQPILEVMDEGGQTDTYSMSVTVKKNMVRSSYTDPRDGEVYRIVLVDDLWWFSENLRYGITIPLDAKPADNQVTEKYEWDPADSTDMNLGGYYTWMELTDYQTNFDQGICPPGWRVMTAADARMIGRFSFYGDGDFFLGRSGYLGIDLDFGGFFATIDTAFHNTDGGFLWITDHQQDVDGINQRIASFGYNYVIGVMQEEWDPDITRTRGFWPVEWGNNMDFNKLALNVRCVKNRD
jgi:hypothetical protein